MGELVYDKKEYSDSFPERFKFCNMVCGGRGRGRGGAVSETGMRNERLPGTAYDKHCQCRIYKISKRPRRKVKKNVNIVD